MKRAAIDLGTNTCLLLIQEFEEEAAGAILEDRATIVRLGHGVAQTKELRLDAIERTVACLKGYSEVCQSHGLRPETVVAVTTATARAARNSVAFFEEVKRETGFEFVTISGEQEASLTFKGALAPGLDPDQVTVLDIGGGSTELQSKERGVSLDFGAVFLTERFINTDPVTDREFWNAQYFIDDALEASGYSKTQSLVGVAGTITSIAALQLEQADFDRESVEGIELTRGDVHRWVEELKWRSNEERIHLPGMPKGREDVLLAGALILWRVMEWGGWRAIRVSTRGLRYGVLQANLEARLRN